MATQVQGTVYQIDGNPLASEATISFPCGSISINETTISTISEVNSVIRYYPNPSNLLFYQSFYVSESVSDLVTDCNDGGTTQVQTTIFSIDESPLIGGGIEYSFPADNISIWEYTDTSLGVNSFIIFKGIKYYSDATEAALVSAANTGGGSVTIPATSYADNATALAALGAGVLYKSTTSVEGSPIILITV